MQNVQNLNDLQINYSVSKHALKAGYLKFEQVAIFTLIRLY